MTRKPKRLGILLLVAFIGLMAIPFFSAPAASLTAKQEQVHFENGDDHASHWLIRSVSESEELNGRSEVSNNNNLLLFDCCIHYHSNILRVSLTQANRWEDVRLPKERLYLINSVFTI
jgi:hypothetical protein